MSKDEMQEHDHEMDLLRYAILTPPSNRQNPTKREIAQHAAQVLLDQFIALADGLDVENAFWDATYDRVLGLLALGLENEQ